MRKAFLISVILLCGALSAYAQSTVYVFYSPKCWEPAPIKINGKEAFRLNGTVKVKFLSTNYSYSASKKKCTLYSEGKTIFSFEMSRSKGSTGIVYKYADEVQLTLSENSVHYIKITPQRGTDYAFVEIDEKEGLKLLKNKKYVLTPEYIEER